jgi:hypothetical protein
VGRSEDVERLARCSGHPCRHLCSHGLTRYEHTRTRAHAFTTAHAGSVTRAHRTRPHAHTDSLLTSGGSCLCGRAAVIQMVEDDAWKIWKDAKDMRKRAKHAKQERRKGRFEVAVGEVRRQFTHRVRPAPALWHTLPLARVLIINGVSRACRCVSCVSLWRVPCDCSASTCRLGTRVSTIPFTRRPG